MDNVFILVMLVFHLIMGVVTLASLKDGGEVCTPSDFIYEMEETSSLFDSCIFVYCLCICAWASYLLAN